MIAMTTTNIQACGSRFHNPRAAQNQITATMAAMMAPIMLTPKKFIGPSETTGRIPSSLSTSITARIPAINAIIAKSVAAKGRFILSSNSKDINDF
jgi:hypothetical protein